MIIGYARVSTQEQNLDRQIDQLSAVGCDKILSEKVSGAGKERPVLKTLLEMLGKDDVVIVTELTRLGRSTKELFEILEIIRKSQAYIKSLKEPWLDTTTPTGRLMFTFVAGIAQFERDIIRERIYEGLKSARSRGRNGGRPKKNADSIKQAITLYDSRNYTISEITKQTGVSAPTLYRYIKARSSKEN